MRERVCVRKRERERESKKGQTEELSSERNRICFYQGSLVGGRNAQYR